MPLLTAFVLAFAQISWQAYLIQAVTQQIFLCLDLAIYNSIEILEVFEQDLR